MNVPGNGRGEKRKWNQSISTSRLDEVAKFQSDTRRTKPDNGSLDHLDLVSCCYAHLRGKTISFHQQIFSITSQNISL